jgi:hypothetical protein
VPNSGVEEQLPETNIDSIPFSQQQSSVKTGKVRRQPCIYELSTSPAYCVHHIPAGCLGPVHGYKVTVTSHIAPDPYLLIGKILSVIESAGVVEVPHRSNADTANQELSYCPVLFAVSNAEKYFACDPFPTSALFECFHL